MGSKRLAVIIILVAIVVAGLIIYLKRGPVASTVNVPGKQPARPTLVDAGGFVEPAEPGKKTVELTATVTDGKFSPSALSVLAGDRVLLTLVNLGNKYHNWTAMGKYLQVATPTIAPNQKITISFVAAHAETIDFYCSLADHEKSGEKGTLTVE